MAIGYSSKAVANWFLNKFNQEKRPCTQLEINKLVFIAHGWHLGLWDHKMGLIGEPVLAWKLGPVIPSLREEFRECGSSPIRRFATEIISSEEYYTPTLEDSEATEEDFRLLEWVWGIYGKKSAGELIEITHLPDSPWSVVTKNGADVGFNKTIPTDIIRDYYKGYVDKLSTNTRR